MKPKNIILVDESSEGLRIDKYLKDKLNLPFSLLHKEFRKKNILINNKKVAGNHRLQKNDKVYFSESFKATILEMIRYIYIANLSNILMMMLSKKIFHFH